MPRIRTRSLAGLSGGVFRVDYDFIPDDPDVIKQTDGKADYVSTCRDEFGFRDLPYSVDTVTTSMVANASYHSEALRRRFTVSNWNYGSTSGFAHLPDPSLPSDPAFAVMVLARTNPSRPLIDIPSSIFELRDIPHLLKGAGDKLFKRPGHAHLAAQFGLAPLVSDFKKLLKFQESVEKRVKLLKQLSEGPMLRKVSLGSYTTRLDIPGEGTLQSTPFGVYGGNGVQTTHREVWGYVRWSPTPSFDTLVRDDGALRAKARQIVGGYSPDSINALRNLWNVLPWSWLVDWFSNVGDYLQAHQNSVPLTHDVPRICCTTTTIQSFSIDLPNFRGPWTGVYEHGSGSRKLVSKTRALASASLPSAFLPLLTGRQIGILSALAITRV